MSIESEILDKEFDRTLDYLALRASRTDFSLGEIEQELHYLYQYQGQGWVGRSAVKDAEIEGQIAAYQVFIARYKKRQEIYR